MKVAADSAYDVCAEQVFATIPYWSGGIQQRIPFDDEQIRWFIARVREWASFPRQRETLRSATNYEFMRARRVIRIVVGIFSRTARLVPPREREALDEFGRRAVIAFGRPTLLPLIMVLRDPSGRQVIPMLLDLSRGMKARLPPASPH